MRNANLCYCHSSCICSALRQFKADLFHLECHCIICVEGTTKHTSRRSWKSWWDIYCKFCTLHLIHTFNHLTICTFNLTAQSDSEHGIYHYAVAVILRDILRDLTTTFFKTSYLFPCLRCTMLWIADQISIHRTPHILQDPSDGKSISAIISWSTYHTDRRKIQILTLHRLYTGICRTLH